MQETCQLIVGLNAHLLSLASTYRSAGIHRYSAQLLHALPGCAPQMHFVAFLHDRRFTPPAAPNLTVEYSRWPTSDPWRRIVGEQCRLPMAARAAHVQLLHGLAFVAPLCTSCPTVVTVHDLSFIRFPQAFRPFNRLYLTYFTRRTVCQAAAVIAVSQYTKDELGRLWRVPAGKVHVVPNGYDPRFCPGDPAEVEAFRQRAGLPARYLFFLGTLEPRKNLLNLVRAYGRSGAQRQGVSLIIAGGKGWYYEALFQEVIALGLQDNVYFTGYLPDDDIVWWYRGAEAFVYPSLYEGFGLPVLEAMACGTPVITSRCSALPEVAGDAALLVEPTDVDALAGAIAHLVSDPVRQQDLRMLGLQRAALFSWQRTARETVVVYEKIQRGREPSDNP